MQDNHYSQENGQKGPDLVCQPGMIEEAHDPGASIKKRLETEQAVKSGARWFYWIAGLSVINTVMVLAGIDITFVVGLGITLIIETVAIGMAGTYAASFPIYFAFGMSIFISSIFVVIGYYAGQKREYVFIAGMALYTVDGTLFLMLADYLGLAFHAVALIYIYKGYSSITKLKQMQPTPSQPSAPDGIPEGMIQ